MAVNVQRLPNEPIVVITMIPPVNPMQDAPRASQEAFKLKQECGGHVYRILDFSQVKLTFSDLVMGMAEDSHQPGGMADKDVTTVFIGSGELVAFGVKSFAEQKQYGLVNPTQLFTSLDAALADIRQKMTGK